MERVMTSWRKASHFYYGSDMESKHKREIERRTHPRTKERLKNLDIADVNPLIKFLKPFGFCDYIKLQQEAFCVISDHYL